MAGRTYGCQRAAELFARALAVHEAPGLLLRSGCARASGTTSVVKEREAGGLGALPAQTGSRETAHAAFKPRLELGLAKVHCKCGAILSASFVMVFSVLPFGRLLRPLISVCIDRDDGG